MIDFCVPRDQALRIEGGLLRRFKRQCHHYVVDVPEDGNVLEWLALMRHYGAPTRLLDWTYSFYVALYFALEGTRQKCKPYECAVWALDTDWMKHRVRAILGDNLWCDFRRDEQVRTQHTFNSLFAQERKLVIAVTPYRLSDRLAAQQGLFFCPGDVSVGFEGNLDAFCFCDGSSKEHLIKYTIVLSPAERNRCLEQLRRMNINHTTLFPGLAGFAGSLKTLLAERKILQPDPNWPSNRMTKCSDGSMLF